MSYRKRASMSYMLKRKWSPPKYGLCPKCEKELMEKLKEKGMKPPPPPGGELPEWTEIRPRGRSSGSDEGQKKQKQKEKQKEPQKQQEPQKSEKQQEKPQPQKPQKPPEQGPLGPLKVSPEDIKKAREGSEDVSEEFEKAQQIKVDKKTPLFKPIISAGPASAYRDQDFIRKMRTALKEWRAGYVEKPQKYGSILKVKQYIKTKGKYPYITRIKKSAKGRKILFVADFSGSVHSFQEHYKKALVSALEVLDSIGVKTALFGFGGEPSGGDYFFFKIKKFEEPKWTVNHAAKVAALQGYGGTPTDRAYRGLEKYIKEHRPDVVVTLTDGFPDSFSGTEEMVKRLKKYTKMVAFGIAGSEEEAERMEAKLKFFGYNKAFTITTDQMSRLPKKLVDLIAPT